METLSRDLNEDKRIVPERLGTFEIVDKNSKTITLCGETYNIKTEELK